MNRIGDYCDVISGYAFKAGDLKEEGDIPVIKIGNISNGQGIILDDNSQYVKVGFLSLNKKYHIAKGDILISLTGSHINQPNSMVGRCCKSSDETVYLLNQRAGKIIPKGNVDSGYLYYLFQLKALQYSVANLAYGGANQVNVSPKDIMGIKWDFPSISTQVKISSTLSAYDSQIENNQKRIKLLEQMAENLYKEWFVRFRFPGYENAEFEGGLPKGWQRKNLTDIMIFQKGVESGSDAYTEDKTLTPFFRVGDIEDKEPTYYVDVNTLQKYQLVQPMDVLCSFDGTVGRVAIGLEGLYSSGMCKISPKNKNISPAYVYYLMKSQPVQNTIQTFANGSTILHAGKSIKKLQTYFEASVVKEYGEIATPILNEILSLEKENRLLTHQRDLLLHRLISGKLSI